MKKINYSINVKCWKDHTTGSWIIYSKKFDISAYGETKSKAKKMFDFTITEILSYTKPKKQLTLPKYESKYKPTTKLHDTDASVRLINSVTAYFNIYRRIDDKYYPTLGDIANMTEKEVLAIRNFGRYTLTELENILALANLKLKQS